MQDETRPTPLALAEQSLGGPSERPFECRFGDSWNGRLRAHSALQQLCGSLVRRGTAIGLGQWCRARELGTDLHLELVADVRDEPDEETMAKLEVGRDDEVRLRSVELTCGNLILGGSQTWYVPKRLTAGAIERLAGGSELFEQAVSEMEPVKIGFGSRILWSPAPVNGMTLPAKPGASRVGADAPLTLPWLVAEYTLPLRNKQLHPIGLSVDLLTREVLSASKRKPAIAGRSEDLLPAPDR